jgi:hypothetical protein
MVELKVQSVVLGDHGKDEHRYVLLRETRDRTTPKG